MKSANDPRHKRRRHAVKELFALDFTPQESGELAQEVMKHKDEIDALITNAAPQWPLEKLNRIDLAILRLATYETNFTDTPHKVAIDEAVELAKEFGGENSPSFINGVLGKIVTDLGKDKEEKKEDENNQNQ